MTVSRPGRFDFGVAPIDEVRRRNLGKVLQLIHTKGPHSRAQLTHALGVNRSTVASLVQQLREWGFVSEKGTRAAGAGRPSLMVHPVSSSAQVIAVEVAVSHLHVAAMGLAGEVIARETIPTQGCAPSRVVELMVESIQRHRGHARILGVGISIAAVVDQASGMVRFGPNLQWSEIPLRQMLEDELVDLPVFVANDGDVGVLAEHIRGVAQGADDVLYVSGDVGIGGGLISAGRSVAGRSGLSGEMGHMKVQFPGVGCHCGATGCWETQIGASAIQRMCQWNAPAEQILPRLAELTEPPQALATVAASLGRGLGSLVNLLNPEVVVLAGLPAQLWRLAAESVLEALESSLLVPDPSLRIVLGQLGQDTALHGSAELVWGHFLSDPALML